MFWAEYEKISEFLSENFHFLVVKFSVYLNRRVFVMQCNKAKGSLAKWKQSRKPQVGPRWVWPQKATVRRKPLEKDRRRNHYTIWGPNHLSCNYWGKLKCQPKLGWNFVCSLPHNIYLSVTTDNYKLFQNFSTTKTSSSCIDYVADLTRCSGKINWEIYIP